MKYVKENNFTHVVDNKDTEEIKKGIIKVFDEIDYSKNLIKDAQKIFLKNRSTEVNSSKMWILFCD